MPPAALSGLRGWIRRTIRFIPANDLALEAVMGGVTWNAPGPDLQSRRWRGISRLASRHHLHDVAGVARVLECVGQLGPGLRMQLQQRLAAPDLIAQAREQAHAGGGPFRGAGELGQAREAAVVDVHHAPAAGVRLLARLGDEVGRGQPLLELHAQTGAELAYALEYARDAGDIVQVVA
jgi:hypothetical protein